MFGASMEDIRAVLVETAVSYSEAVLRIFLIIFAGYIGIRLVRFFLHRLETILVQAKEKTETVPGSTKKRVTTLVGILQTLARFGIWVVVVIICLDQLGVNVAPILAGAGIAGLALGFGAQNLVRDVITGFFIILEDQIRLGDVAVINGTGGGVEAITFRTITLRDFSGVVHVFPNGTISTLSNMTKGWSASVMDIGVAYKEDTDKVCEVIQRVGDELKADPEFGPKMLETVQILGVDGFGDSDVKIKIRIRTQPSQQWGVGREFRRRIKMAFDAAGIEIPFPHQSLYWGEASRPFEVLMKDGEGKK
ncbi:MAG TPA: mechanosensitive ion channel family protein [Nitrospiria bacterium]|nr:mechanosensitive ion channel family protein [Nitrospiria bacterium]